MRRREEEAALPELLDALRWRWGLALLVAVPLFAGAFLYVQRLPDEYEARAIVSVGPRPESFSADLVRIGAPKYVAYVTAPSTVLTVADRLDEDPAALHGAVGAELATDTGDVTIVASHASPEGAAEIANAFAEQAVAFSEGDPLLFAAPTAHAVPAAAPAGPPRAPIQAAALAMGLLLGATAALVVERGRPRIRTWRDVALLTGFPVLGRVPAGRAARAFPAAALADPRLGGAVRALRTSLERELGGRAKGVVVVTSALPREGKTTIAALLATALARLDLQVLLVDGDLRSARLSEHVGASRGLSEVLRGLAPVEASVRPGWAEGLAVLPTAPDREAGDLLARGVDELVRQALGAFDVVVVDTPSLHASEHAFTLASAADMVLLVVAAGTAADRVGEAAVMLHAATSAPVGVAANRLRLPRRAR